MVKRLLCDGIPIVACDRRADDAKAWLERLEPSERERVAFHPLDVTKEEQVNALAGELTTTGVHIAYLVNNAGIQGAGKLAQFDSKTWNRVVNVNLNGTFYLTRAFTGEMAERRFGRIVNVASLYAYHPGRGQLPYAAAKAGIAGFTRAVARDLGRDGITANTIAPGFVLHERLRELFGDGDWERLLAGVPVGRAGRPEEIAATLAFLCSEDAAYITGQTIHVNGGLYLPG